MHTQELTDLEAMLEGEIACTALHHEPYFCSVEVVAIGWTDCQGAVKNICQSSVNYIEDARADGGTCGECGESVWLDWHYRLI